MAYKKLYRVKPSVSSIKLHNLIEGNSVVDGYLAFYGVIQNYRNSEAHKKAVYFDGTIDPYTHLLCLQ